MYNPKLHFHFTGIGGSGMSGLAEILLTLGFKVSGSDLKGSEVSERLIRLGADVKIGHATENLAVDASLVVYSSAVSQENPEIIEAKRRGLPVIRRAEVLAELMRLKYGVAVAGSHGKTTTTSMTAQVLEYAGLDPTVIVGGQVQSMGSGGRVGKSDYLVAESDESDRSFLLLKPTIAVITNIDNEHLSAYGTFAELERSFAQFLSAVPFYGLAVLCIDDPCVRRLAEQFSGRKVTYGFSEDADLRIVNVELSQQSTRYEVCLHGKLFAKIELPMLGRHIALNSLAAIAVGSEFGIPADKIERALGAFSGVKRRLEVCGVVDNVTVISDYGHHPVEVRATLSAVKQGWGENIGKLHVIFQPHRFTRTRDCFDDFLTAFDDSDKLLVSDIYSAGEEPIPGITSESLCAAMSHPDVTFCSKLESAVETVLASLKPGDVVICQGAGSIGAIPEQILSALETRVREAA